MVTTSATAGDGKGALLNGPPILSRFDWSVLPRTRFSCDGRCVKQVGEGKSPERNRSPSSRLCGVLYSRKGADLYGVSMRRASEFGGFVTEDGPAPKL